MEGKSASLGCSSDSSETSYDSNRSPSVKCETGDRPFNVYVKGFSQDVDTKKLTSLFSEFGSIQSCTVLCDHSGRSKQVGFVQFCSDEEAHKAVKEMNGKEGLGPKLLHVALTNPKPPRTPKKKFAVNMNMPFASGMPPPTFPGPFAAPQPGVFNPAGWPPCTGPMPIMFFQSPYTPPHFPQQQPGGAFGYESTPVSQPASQPHGIFPAGPYMVPFSPNIAPAGNMMMNSRPMCTHSPNFVPGFCNPGAPYPGVAWALAYSSQMGAVPAAPPKTRFVS